MNEAAGRVLGKCPDFDLDAGTFVAGDMHETWLRWNSTLECVELVVGMSAAGADETATSLGELPIQWLAGEMSAYDGHEQATCGWCGCGQGPGFVELAGPAANGRSSDAVEAVGESEESSVVKCGRNDADAKGKPIGAESCGDCDGGEVEQVDEVGVGAEVAVEFDWIGSDLGNGVSAGRCG